MAVICPTILADNTEEYDQEIQVVAPFAHRLQIDLSDGKFSPTKTVKPGQAWWPAAVKVDFHLMFQKPQPSLQILLAHKPYTIIAHAEADGDFRQFAQRCLAEKVRTGVALLPGTHPDEILPALEYIDHVLIFSGKLGSYGGRADLGLLDKVDYLKRHKPDLEIGWDGGIDDQNAAELILGGVDVLNVGGFIQQAEDPKAAYLALERIADETGTT